MASWGGNNNNPNNMQQRNPNNNNRRGGEDGEIGEEEGEISIKNNASNNNNNTNLPPPPIPPSPRSISGPPVAQVGRGPIVPQQQQQQHILGGGMQQQQRPPPQRGGWRGGGRGGGGFRGGAGGGRGGMMNAGQQRHGSFSGQMFLPPNNNPPAAAVRSQSFSGVMAASNHPAGASHRPPAAVAPARPTDPRFRGAAMLPDIAAAAAARPPLGDAVSSPLPPPPAGGPSPAAAAAQVVQQQQQLMPLRCDGPPPDSFSPRPPPIFRGNNQSAAGLLPPPPPLDSSFRALADSLDNNNPFRPGIGPSSETAAAAAAGPMGDAGPMNNFLRGPVGPMMQQQRRGPDNSNVPDLPPGSDGNFRPLLRDNSFRGGRRGSDNSFRGGGEPFRGGGGPPGEGPPFRGPGDNVPPFRGGGGGDYYGPPPGGGGGIGGEFRRSPSQRGRPSFGRGGGASGVPPPPLNRQATFPHRRNDPRFATSKDALDPQQQDLPQQQRPPLFDGPATTVDDHPTNINPGNSFGSSSGPFHRKPPPVNRGASDSDVFGRTREWPPNNRPSPQVSPQNRKPSLLKFFQQSPNNALPPPPVAPAFAPAAAAAPNELTPAAAAAAVVQNEKSTLPPVDEQPPPLLTSALGDDLADRAEKVVAEVRDILGSTDLKAAEGKLSKLPSKQHILQAVARMDAKIKSSQKGVEEKKKRVDDAVKDEEEQHRKAKEDAIADAKRQVEERLRMEEEKRSEEIRAQEGEIQTLIEERKSLFDDEQRKTLSELEAKLKLAKEDEERKMREALNEQLITTADNFDKDIVQMRKELERATQITKKTEARLANVENDYRTKMEQAKKEGPVDTAPKPSDLVSTIIAENRRLAAEAHLNQLTFVSQDEESSACSPCSELEDAKDPTAGKTTAEWAQMAKQVTGLADALYSEPSEAPYFAHNEKTHTLIAPLVQEYVRDKQNRLKKRWMQLAEEYEYRRTQYDKQLHSGTHAKDKPRKSLSIPVRHSILQGGKPSQPILESAGARASTNPYRRARRGNEVRSEYEQEQIIAEIAAKEALEKRITFGGTDLPRQIGRLERELTGQFVNTFTAQRVDLIEQERELALTNVWSDMEKAIFLDRWLQFPKDFKKIALFLRNKTTKDCVRFYYDSKQSVPYKGALREHIMRRKRRGDYHVWNATIEAALSVGVVVEAGTSEDKPLVFLLPERDDTYFTRNFHPMKREIFDAMEINEVIAADFDEDDNEDMKRPGRSRKRPREPLFVLDSVQAKFLKNHDSTHAHISSNKSQSRSSKDGTGTDGSVTDEAARDDGGLTPIRKAPQKWSAHEKRIFLETLEKHGRNWLMLSQAVGTKSISQIKNYFYDYKKQVGRGRGDKKSIKEDAMGKATRREDDMVTPPPEQSESLPETPGTVDVSLKEPPSSFVNESPEQIYQSIHAQHPQHPTHEFQQSLHSQHRQQNYHVGSGDLHMANAMQPEMERSLPHSGTSTPDAMNLWAQAHHHAQLSEEAARRLLQHHHSQQHQQILSNLLPWVNSGQLSHSAASSLQDQQLQSLLQLQQQQQQQQPQNHYNHLAALSGLAGLASSASGMAGLGQQHHHHQQHHQQQHQQQHHLHHSQQHQPQHSQHHHQRQNSHDAQLVLAQHLLNLQAQGGGSAADALGLLARSLPDSNRNNNSQGGSYHGAGHSGQH